MISPDALKPDPTTLPDDPTVLKQLVLQLFDELQKSREQVERMERHMDLLLRRVYGRTSEKLDPNQGLLFELPGESSAEGAKGTESVATNGDDSSLAETFAEPALPRPRTIAGYAGASGSRPRSHGSGKGIAGRYGESGRDRRGAERTGRLEAVVAFRDGPRAEEIRPPGAASRKRSFACGAKRSRGPASRRRRFQAVSPGRACWRR